MTSDLIRHAASDAEHAATAFAAPEREAAAAFEPVNGHALIRLAAAGTGDIELPANGLPLASSEGSVAMVAHDALRELTAFAIAHAVRCISPVRCTLPVIGYRVALRATVAAPLLSRRAVCRFY
jgi:hypothetical protein